MEEDLLSMLEKVELRKDKQMNYLTFIEHIAKINILYLEGKISAEKAMQGVCLMTSKLNQNLEELNKR